MTHPYQMNHLIHYCLSLCLFAQKKKYNRSKQIVHYFIVILLLLSRNITSSFINLFSSCQWNSQSDFKPGYCPAGPVPHPFSCKSTIIIFRTEAAILKDFVLFWDCLLKRVFPACMPAGELCLHWLEILWEMKEECKGRMCDLIVFFPSRSM